MVIRPAHQPESGGVLLMHFGIFVLLAFLVYYRDWLPIVLAAGLIAAHHLAFFALQQQGVGVRGAPGQLGVILLHAFYVVLESAILIYLARQAMPKRARANPAAGGGY